MDRPRRVAGLVPTISFVGLFFLLHAVAATASILVANFDYGGPGMGLLSLIGLAVLIAQWLRARRHAPLWPALLYPCALVLVAAALLWAEMKYVRSSFEDLVELERMSWFLEGMGELLNLPALAATLASLGFSHVVWLGASRIRRRRSGSRAEAGSVAIAVVGITSAIGMLGWRWHQGQLGYGALILAPVAALITGLGLLLAVLGIRNGSAEEDRVRQNASDLILSGLAAASSAAMMGVAGHSRLLAATHRLAGGESVDPSLKSRILEEGSSLADLEFAFGFAGVCVVLVLTLATISSLRLIRASQLTPASWLTFASIAVVVPIPWMQANTLASEAPEYREGALGELVEDRSIPKGTLIVTLQGLTPGIDPWDEAELKVTGAAPAKYRNPAGATLSVQPGTGFQVAVGEPYIARVAGPFTMPAHRGARLRIGVLRVARGFMQAEPEEPYENPLILQLDTTDPSRFRILWSVHQNVHSSKDVARSIDALPGELRQAWNAAGSHRNDADAKFDTAVIRYQEPPNIDELVQLSKAIQTVERTFRGRTVGAFKTLVLPVRQYAEGLEPGELDKLAGLDLLEAAEAIPAVIERCRVKCPSGVDLFGRLIGQSCGEYRCSVAELAGLHMKLGAALASRGDRAGAGQQFERALLLNPTSGLGPDAPAEAREALASVRVPSVGLRLGALTVNGRITPQAIASTFEGRLGLYRACGATLAGPMQCRIAVRFVIAPDGGTTKVANAGSDCPSVEAVQCVISNTRGMTFPRPEGGIATVVLPMMFTRK